ncbi:hypothetical protein AB0A71_30535 [Kitasatospora aureofaciens]|uniref:hypothetical protein n=1 Tax=Kitasatospora aureofaciens TaxID=1894 RepID=UPI0033F05EAD
MKAARPPGRPAGRIELYDVERGTWVALIDSRIVTNAASSEPLRCATSAEAPALLRPALRPAPVLVARTAPRGPRAHRTVRCAPAARTDSVGAAF